MNVIEKIPKIISITLTFMCLTVLIVSLFISNSLPSVFRVTADENINLDLILPVTVQKSKTKYSAERVAEIKSDKNFSVDLKLFGVIPIKNAMVEKCDEKRVYLGGNAFGIKLYTDGVIVVSMSDVDTESGNRNPAKEAGIRVGDRILAVNGKTIYTNKELSDINGSMWLV